MEPLIPYDSLDECSGVDSGWTKYLASSVADDDGDHEDDGDSVVSDASSGPCRRLDYACMGDFCGHDEEDGSSDEEEDHDVLCGHYREGKDDRHAEEGGCLSHDGAGKDGGKARDQDGEGSFSTGNACVDRKGRSTATKT